MNVNSGGKQTKMHLTIIPMDNPPPPPGQIDPQGWEQLMVYPDDHPNPNLCSKAKGMKAILQEHGVVWDILVSKSTNHSPVGMCERCRMSQAAKDAAAWVAGAEASGQELDDEADVLKDALEESVLSSNWCCMLHILSLQSDFKSEKPLIQQYVEKQGHICVFLPKFHCGLNPIELYWGYAKHRELFVTGNASFNSYH